MLVERTADPSAAPDFLSSLATPQIFMRFSLQKTAHAALSSAASRKSGYVRDDKGEDGAFIGSRCLMNQHSSTAVCLSSVQCRGKYDSPLCHPEQLTCLRQVEGEMTRGLSALPTNAWPIQAFFWLEWGCRRPNPPLVSSRELVTFSTFRVFRATKRMFLEPLTNPSS